MSKTPNVNETAPGTYGVLVPGHTAPTHAAEVGGAGTLKTRIINALARAAKLARWKR